MKQDEFPKASPEPNESGIPTFETLATCGKSKLTGSRQKCGFVVRSSSLASSTEELRNRFLRMEVVGLLEQLPISSYLEAWKRIGGDVILVYELSLTVLPATSENIAYLETLTGGSDSSTDPSSPPFERDGTTSPSEE